MDRTLDRLRELGISRAEVALALNVSLSDLEQWLVGALRTEVADMIEVGLLLLEMRFCSARVHSEEPTLRIAVA
ncbi:MAG TPA: hypothetical protein VGK31_08095 [Thermoanaerobaculia bacterium]